MGTDLEKGKQLYQESADWCAQKLSLLDKRDQQQIKTISLKVQTLAMRAKVRLANETDHVYISTRASLLQELLDVRKGTQGRSNDGVAPKGERSS